MSTKIIDLTLVGRTGRGHGSPPTSTKVDRPSATPGQASIGDAIGLVGSSPAVVELRTAIPHLAKTPYVVLIYGDSGTGKELVARAIHTHSPRRDGPFIPVNCGAFVETLLEAELFGIEDGTATGVRRKPGQFELADKGTLFLDEVAELSPHAQATLLRVLQDFTIRRVGGDRARRVDTRVIAATNRSLADLVKQRTFREDLFYRLSRVIIPVASLRERPADIPALLAHALNRNGANDRTFTRDAMDVLLRYPWPGNVRELEGFVERCLTWPSSAREIGIETVLRHLLTPPREPAESTMRAQTAKIAQATVDACHGNRQLACRILNITPHTLQTYLARAANNRPRTT
jgi:two-component system response regulator HydG